MSTPHRKHNPRRKPVPGNRQALWVRKRRSKLIALLGGKCAHCGEDDEATLEFNHLEPRDWEPNKCSQWGRMARYWRDFERGILNLLCRSCNAAAGHPSKPVDTSSTATSSEEPF